MCCSNCLKGHSQSEATFPCCCSHNNLSDLGICLPGLPPFCQCRVESSCHCLLQKQTTSHTLITVCNFNAPIKQRYILTWYCSGVIWAVLGNWLGLGVGMSIPPIGVAAGVMPMGVAPTPGVAAGVAPKLACPAGVSSHLDRPFFAIGVAPTAGVSPGAHPGVAPPSICTIVADVRNKLLTCLEPQDVQEGRVSAIAKRASMFLTADYWLKR